MRTVNVQKKQVLFLALLVSLGASKSWLTTSVSGNADLSQSAPVADAPIVIRLRAEAKPEGSTETRTEDITVKVVRETRSTTIVSRDGEIKPSTESYWVARFESSACSDCMESKEIPIVRGVERRIDAALLKPMADASLKALLEKEVRAEAEAKKKRGNLEAREKRAGRCQIEIVDANDASKDVRLQNGERIECLAKTLDEKEFKTESAEYAAVKNALRGELSKLVFSKDAEVRESGYDALTDLQDRFDNEMLQDYFHGMERVAIDANGLFERIETIQEFGPNSQEGLQARLDILSAKQPYLLGSYRYGASRYEVAGIEGMRAEMLKNLSDALQSPDRRMLADRGSDITGNSAIQYERGENLDRHDINIDRFPFLSFTGGSSNRNGANNTDPRMDPRYQTRPMYQGNPQQGPNMGPGNRQFPNQGPQQGPQQWQQYQGRGRANV